MCAHASSANDIIDKIGNKLYPFIADQFQELYKYNLANIPCENASLMFEVADNLKHEFESLRNYETKLVFPSVKMVFETKDNPGFTPSVNLHELQLLTQKKEAFIKDLVGDIQSEADALGIFKSHPIHAIIFVFNDAFFPEKQKWHQLLAAWDKGCTCFAKAKEQTINKVGFPNNLNPLTNGNK